ncbi:MAG: M48 family metalloprotease [Polyangiaceae bacterium]
MSMNGECPRCRGVIPPGQATCPWCGNPAAYQAPPGVGATYVPQGGQPPQQHGQPYGGYPQGGYAPQQPPQNLGAPAIPRPPGVPTRRGGGSGVLVAIAVFLLLVGVAAGVFVVLKKKGTSSSDDNSITENKKSSSTKDRDPDSSDSSEPKPKNPGGNTYSPAAEPEIPASVASFKVDPRELKRGDGRAVKPDSKEIDLSKDISYDAAKDPYCKQESHFADILKEVGYNIDQELRKASTITEAEEEKIGDETFKEVAKHPKFAGKIDTPNMAAERRYLTELAVPFLAQVQRKGIVYEFHTIDDNTMNAFAIPGGHIFFHRGILTQARRVENEAQLAGVLAHEINHVDKRHTIAIFEYLKGLGMSSQDDLGTIVVSMARHPFSSKQEDEADEMAVRFLIAADYSPKQFVEMWKTWDQLDKRGKPKSSDPLDDELQELFQTHSPPARRACNAMKVTMKYLNADADRYYVGTTNWKEKKTRARGQH